LIARICAADHPGQFLYPAILVEPLHGCDRSAAADALLDRKVARAGGRDLRQMRNAQDLEALAERPEFVADHSRHPSADPRVDFVEDQRLPRLICRGERLEGEHHSRQLPAGDDTRQRPQLLARVWREVELPRVDPAFRPAALLLAGREAYFETRLLHRQVRQLV
jgi:hypothetical protein